MFEINAKIQSMLVLGNICFGGKGRHPNYKLAVFFTNDARIYKNSFTKPIMFEINAKIQLVLVIGNMC